MLKQFKKKWQEISASAFVNETGKGKQLLLVDSKYVRVFLQRFSAGTRVDYHNHLKTKEWEVVTRLGWGICLSIYPPNMKHCLFGPPKPEGSWWSIISIKIGKRS